MNLLACDLPRDRLLALLNPPNVQIWSAALDLGSMPSSSVFGVMIGLGKVMR